MEKKTLDRTGEMSRFKAGSSIDIVSARPGKKDSNLFDDFKIDKKNNSATLFGRVGVNYG